jgi:hypothetical protein
MCLFILFFLWTIPDQSRHMPRDLETIADHIALFSQSSLLEDGHFQIDPTKLIDYSAEIPKNVWLQFKSWITNCLKELNASMSAGWKKSNIKKAIIGPPQLVDEVVREMGERATYNGTIRKGKLPRFGTWENPHKIQRQDGDDSYLIGIDINENMLSLLEERFYKPDRGEIFRAWAEQLF